MKNIYKKGNLQQLALPTTRKKIRAQYFAYNICY